MNMQLLLLLSSAVLTFSACKKKDKNSNPTHTSSAQLFRLKHNGTLYSTYKQEVTSNDFMVGISAGTMGETGNYYQVSVRKNLLPGTYEYQGDMDDPMVFLLLSNQMVYAENHGSVTILSNDTILKKIEFEFAFEMLENHSHSDTIQITEGYVQVSY